MNTIEYQREGIVCYEAETLIPLPFLQSQTRLFFFSGLERKLLKKSANCDIIHTTVMDLVICCEYGSSRKEPIVIFIGDVFILCKRFLSQKDFLGFRDEAYE